MVWQPARRRIERLESAAKCESTDRLIRRGAPILALAGSRATWLQLTGGNRLETILKSATLARPTPVWIVAKAAGELSVLAVDAGRIAARTESGIRLLTAGGRVLQDLPVRASAAALSRNRLAVRTRDAVEVYDAGSGVSRTTSLPRRASDSRTSKATFWSRPRAILSRFADSAIAGRAQFA
jgi:hypothetical protein